MQDQTNNEKNIAGVLISELLAFRILCLTTAVQNPDKSVPEDARVRELRDIWQADRKTRNSARSQARQLIEELESRGVRLKISNSKHLAEALDWLKIVPPRVAYDLQEEQGLAQ